MLKMELGLGVWHNWKNVETVSVCMVKDWHGVPCIEKKQVAMKPEKLLI